MAKDFLGLLQQGYTCVGEVDGAMMFDIDGALVMYNTNNVSETANRLFGDFVSEKGIKLPTSYMEAGYEFDQEMVTAE